MEQTVLRRSWLIVGLATLASSLGSAAAGAAPTQSYHIGGVLVSPSGRLAFVNGRIARIGERIDGAEILSIDNRSVRMRAGTEELTAHVGSRVAVALTPMPAAPPPVTSAGDMAVEAAAADADPLRYGPIARGETLSEIAESFKRDGLTRDQVMTAVFRANPEAFGGNINLLREGATLEVPDTALLRVVTPDAARAEVASQHLAWQQHNTRIAKRADAPIRESYGPVRSGETLSEIAEELMPHGVTRAQMMLALFDANPASFRDNINRLRAGVVLRVPDMRLLARRSPDNATAEVARQVEAWLGASNRQARSSPMCASGAASRPARTACEAPTRGT